MHLRALSLLLTASGLVTLPLAGCGGDTSMTDAGPRDASAAGCGVNNGGCSTTPMVTCSTDADGDAVCGPCPTGYSGDGRVCTSSMPVNECALGTDNCAPQATCTDTAAAFTCACSAGYMGDGVSCTRIGCTDATDCDDGVSCTNDTCGDSGNCIHTPVPALCPVGSSCNLATGCMAGRICGSQDDCVDTDPCTRNETCNPVSATCTFTVLDNDMDGEPPLVCGGTDCNDADEDVGARVPEYCGNLVDDDCNGVVDTDATVDTDVALRNDESNCGSCGNQCDGDETCYQGACVACGGGVGAACCSTYCSAANACTGGSCGPGTDCAITGGAAACAACGALGARCCNGTSCAAGGVCSSGTCTACGGVGQPCCGGGSCGAGNTCSSGSCVLCGGIGQTCCGGSACNAGATCGGSGSCLACGGSGESCCAGAAACDGGLVCSGNACQPCGGVGEACCAGANCDGGAVCDPFGGGVCRPCGGDGQYCCDGESCGSAFECSPFDRTIACHTPTCGGLGEACCFPGGAPDIDIYGGSTNRCIGAAFCAAGICESW